MMQKLHIKLKETMKKKKKNEKKQFWDLAVTEKQSL